MQVSKKRDKVSPSPQGRGQGEGEGSVIRSNAMKRPLRNLIFIFAAGICAASAIFYFRAQKTASITQSIITWESTNAIAAPIIPTPTSTAPTDQTLAHLRDLFAQDPSDQTGRAAELLNQECRDKNFATTLALMDAVPRDLRADWLKIIFNRWAQAQPKDAMQALAQLGDPDERAGAFQAAVAGWNSSDPAGLANYAINQPTSDDRDYALTSALENWSLQDPTALATWLNTLPRGAEFDYGAALMLAKTDGANRSPELAMQWVENIADPALKRTSFARVIAEWLRSDAAAAKQYVASANWLDDSARSKILNATR